MTSHHYQHHRKTKHFRHSGHRGSTDQQTEDFLVFGYSAKLHSPRDDHRPSDDQEPIDENVHLIPWNGDERLKIDRVPKSAMPSFLCSRSLRKGFQHVFSGFFRPIVSSLRNWQCICYVPVFLMTIKLDGYDVRLYLSTLDEFDDERLRGQRRKRTSAEGEAEEEDSAEKLEEELCEEERFLDLYDDIRKREIDEVNQKRGKGAEIGFTYEEREAEKIGDLDESEEDELPYEQPPSLKLPVGIITPETMRQNALIERTAQFVVAQGLQMEVVIKAKQRQNAEQFGFLDFDHRLHSYYKYMCKLIREKKYMPQPQRSKRRKQIEPSASEPETDSENDNDGYLHPSLLGGGPKTKVAEDASSSPVSGFIGPSPRPPPQKVQRKAPSPGPDLDLLIQQCHSSSSANSIYSSLLKGLHSVLPGSSSKSEQAEKPDVESSPSQQLVGHLSKDEPMAIPAITEVDQQRTDEYNRWHMEFYGRPSPFLPGPPSACQRPVPDSAVESAISVAAKYVALHGAFAEQRLIEHNQDKVHFLQARSPYYTFYQSQVRQIQWRIFQQSQQLRQHPFPLVAPFSTAVANTAVQSSSPQNAAESMTVPTQITLMNSIDKSGDTEPKEAEPDSKQLERREKARLFMEKILNERMAEKNRVRTKPLSGTVSASANATSSAPAADVVTAAHPMSSSALSPLALSKAISHLIDEQIKRTLGTTSPQLPEEGKKKREKRRHEEERRKRRKKGRTRQHSKSSSHSTTSSTASTEEDDDDTDTERSRKRRKRRRKSNNKKGGREHGANGSDGDEEEEEKSERRRRRKRKHHRKEDNSSSFSHRHHH